MTPRAEELWSYMTGLAPVGEIFRLDRRSAFEDLSFRTHTNLSKHLREVMDAKAVHQADVGLFVVLKRPEERGGKVVS